MQLNSKRLRTKIGTASEGIKCEVFMLTIYANVNFAFVINILQITECWIIDRFKVGVNLQANICKGDSLSPALEIQW